ncbi:hypothetical protein PHMEG_0006695 [Phytophthora megakarya]|uniref:Uncharacterized protein n=1 Tax=Phytophthora megakarya TaxID=4795 RepID=A0A225WNA0_9STRA|nr:hypothetical protein PHMEG_0006695 [Phytophthora megakarya]
MSVVAVLQIMLRVLEWGPNLGAHTVPGMARGSGWAVHIHASFLWGLLTVEQLAWNEIARGRHFSALSPEAASAFRVEDYGNVLMLKTEEKELLSAGMRLAHVRPKDWSESATSRPEPKRRREGTDTPLALLRGLGRRKPTEAWEGLSPKSSTLLA